MLKCSKTLKIALLLTGIYAAFMTVLLTEISSAKYQETRVAYTNFGAASFNAVVLNSTGGGTYQAFNVFDDPLEISRVAGYRPGMSYSADSTKNTARQIPFAVANGVDKSNVSDAGVQYEISLRTTGHLPLKYSLLFDGKLYTAGAQEQIAAKTAIGTDWYEYKFYETAGAASAAIFDLEGGDLISNNYTLIVEWPVTEVGGVKTNDVRYMKEVDLLELFVTVSSKNMLDDPTYGDGVTIQTEPGTGIVILNKQDETSYFHTLDYRAFTKEGEKTFYNFEIENGVGKQVKHTLVNTSYTFEIEVPYTDATKNFVYTLKNADGQTITPEDGGYRLYDVLYSHEKYNGNGGYVRSFESKDAPTADDITKWSKSDSQYKLYKVYKVHVGNPILLDNSKPDGRGYQLILSGTGSGDISGATAFSNKIEIIVTAKETGNALPAAQTEEGGAGDV